MGKIKYVIKRDGSTVSFRQDRITNAIFRAAVSVGGRDRTIAEALSDQVVGLLQERFESNQYPHVEEIQDLVEKVLIENGHARVAKAYILYREERTRRREKEQGRYDQRAEYIPWAKVWSVLDWAVDHGLNTIAGLNGLIENGEIAALIKESEAAYEADIQAASQMILERKNELKLVIIAGPSSSGKTTTTRKIAHHLSQQGLRFLELNLDNYYFDLELHPKDEFGDYDFETPHALDIELINRHLHGLLDGEQILMPFYDFKTGNRQPDQTPLRLGADEIILIDSLYGLYPPLTDGLVERKMRVYIEPLLQMKDNSGKYVRWTDIRLMRRMLRDAIHRSYDFSRTLTHWHYVRSAELRNIIPYVASADYVINSAMPYELALYKPKLREHFAKAVSLYRDDPLRQDAFTRAARVHALFEQLTPIPDDTVVPLDSVIREFIGGLQLE